MDIQEMRHALEHLYANVELAHSALAGDFPDVTPIVDTVERAQALRCLLLDAIESLRPLKSAPPHVLAARGHQVLSLRYVSGLAVDEIAEQLAVGERQVYRDLRRAEEELMAVLAARPAISAPEHAGRETQDALEAELAVLETTPQLADVAELLAGAVETVESLATQRGTKIEYAGPTVGVTAMVPGGLMRQVLVQLLSAGVQCAERGGLAIDLDQNADTVRISIPVRRPDMSHQTGLVATALSLAESSGVRCQLLEDTSGDRVVVLTLRRQSLLPVVVVEDNPGTCSLYQRYLENSPWQSVIAHDPHAACDVALAAQATVIIIDLLMPGLDGWTLLQTLKLDPRTASIPVVVCSVVTDGELASALGAAASLKKPVSRQDLVATLQRVARPHSAA